MAKPFKTLLIALADKAGLAQTDPAFLDLLTKVDAQLDDTAYETLNKFVSDSMTLNVAKAHPEVVKHYNATIFNGMDAKVKSLITEYGLDATEAAAIDAEKNSYEKFKLLSQFSKAKIEKEFKDLKDGDKGKLAEEIKKLNADILVVREASAKEVAAAKLQAENDTTDYAYSSVLNGKKYANEEIPVEVNTITAKTLINSELAKRGAKIVRKDGKLTLVNATNPDLEFIENNKVVNFDEFANSTLATNKLLKVSDAPGDKVPPVRKTQTERGDNKTVDVSGVSSFLRDQAKAMREANA